LQCLLDGDACARENPAARLSEITRRENGFTRLGRVRGVKAEFFAISVERKIRHPAIAAMTDDARQLFAQD
jgi:hypothetical protein